MPVDCFVEDALQEGERLKLYMRKNTKINVIKISEYLAWCALIFLGKESYLSWFTFVQIGFPFTFSSNTFSGHFSSLPKHFKYFFEI